MSPSQVVTLAAGFVFFYCAGVLTGLRLAHRKVNAREVTMQIRDVRRGLERVNAWVAHWLALILLVIFGVAAYSVVSGSRQHSAERASTDAQQAQLQQQSDCVTSYANQLYESLKPRQAASEALQEADARFNSALVALFQVALRTKSDDPRRHDVAVRLAKAAQHKQKVADHLSAERAKNPYPSPPKEVCPR